MPGMARGCSLVRVVDNDTRTTQDDQEDTVTGEWSDRGPGTGVTGYGDSIKERLLLLPEE